MEQHALCYEIRIEGHLAPHRLRHFEGVSLHQEDGDQTVIRGCFRDQPAFYGLLSWLQALEVTLLLVERLEAGPGSRDRPVRSPAG